MRVAVGVHAPMAVTRGIPVYGQHAAENSDVG